MKRSVNWTNCINVDDMSNTGKPLAKCERHTLASSARGSSITVLVAEGIHAVIIQQQCSQLGAELRDLVLAKAAVIDGLLGT